MRLHFQMKNSAQTFHISKRCYKFSLVTRKIVLASFYLIIAFYNLFPMSSFGSDENLKLIKSLGFEISSKSSERLNLFCELSNSCREFNFLFPKGDFMIMKRNETKLKRNLWNCELLLKRNKNSRCLQGECLVNKNVNFKQNSLTMLIKQISSYEFQAINFVMYLNLARVIKMKSTNLHTERGESWNEVSSYL